MRSTPRRTESRLSRACAAGVLALAIASLGACSAKISGPIGQRTTDPGPPMRGGLLRAAFFTDVRGLDPATAFSTTSAAINNLIFDTLVTYDMRGDIVPSLASRFEVDPNGLRHVFHLRRNVVFHDGNKMVADDVKRSIERALHPDTPCPVTSFFSRIAGYEAYRSRSVPTLSGVEVTGEYTVTITLSEPDATFLHVLALHVLAPVCPSRGTHFDADTALQPCGTGPFRLTRFEGGLEIDLVRHDAYWVPGLPYLDGIKWYLRMDGLTQRYKLERGELDYMREFSDVDSRLFRADPRWKGLGAWEPAHTVNGLFMNTEMPPFDNRHVRRAVSLGLDRQQLAKVRPGHVTPHFNMVPTTFQPDVEHYPRQRFDHAEALREMKLAGYPYDPATGRGGYPHEIPYLALIDSFGAQSAEIYQQQLARIGVRIRLQLVGWPTFLALTGRRRTVVMGTAGWHADYPEPSDFFEPILTSGAIADENSQNSAFFRNSTLDKLISRARGSADPATRGQLYADAEKIVAEEAPWAITYSQRFYELWQPYLRGYRPHPVLVQYLRGAWLNRHDQRRAQRRTSPIPGSVPRLGRLHPGSGRKRPGTTLSLIRGRMR